MQKRITANLFIAFSILMFPWWVTVLLVGASILLFERFYEAIVWGALSDLLYGVPLYFFFNIQAVFTILFSVLFLLGEYIKKNVRWYDARQ